ncbi:hypothetical protein GIB67_013327 [Kingdonia uniflora]|uniref:TATA box binding protein associated factor (TAF) histone-like fold domain-containing protein n=1 Tax=Kingdonia uniflora TaxID=39325 RepID=A0A7J7LQP8_9MAGN|nr:hypothetical protein GIB67_013327 [Kingdonia uniflora]
MSSVPKETIEVIAQSIGISNLSPDVALALAPDVEYRVREIMQVIASIYSVFYVLTFGFISDYSRFGRVNGDLDLHRLTSTASLKLQEAIKCMRHSKRTVLTAADVDSALNLRNVEPIYGFASGDPLRFKRAVGHKDLFYIDDKDVEFKDIIEAPLPKAPLDTTVVAHWLAIEGVQPAIPENAPIEALLPPSDNMKSEYKEATIPIDLKLPVKHVLSKELQVYFEKITELTVSRSESVLFKEALVSLATDSGLHPLVPYFTYFIEDEVGRSLNDIRLLFALMRVVRSLLRNPHIHIEPYLQQLVPAVITCFVARRLGNRFSDNHWELRNFSASLVASICKRFAHVYHNVQTRVIRTLWHAYMDPTKSMTTHYGAIQGLAAMGPTAIRFYILPNLKAYMQLLEPEMLLEKQKNELKRYEAWRVYGALLCAAGQCMYDRLKLFPSLLLPPKREIWRTNAKVVTANANKRKATTEHPMQQQPPLKKIATDGLMATQSTDMQVASDGFPPALLESTVGSSSSSGMRQVAHVSSSGSNNRRDARAGNVYAATLRLAWKEDMQAGELLASLFEIFGESILAFTPSPEMSFFL